MQDWQKQAENDSKPDGGRSNARDDSPHRNYGNIPRGEGMNGGYRLRGGNPVEGGRGESDARGFDLGASRAAPVPRPDIGKPPKG